jgi:hypothetical protein
MFANEVRLPHSKGPILRSTCRYINVCCNTPHHKLRIWAVARYSRGPDSWQYLYVKSTKPKTAYPNTP